MRPFRKNLEKTVNKLDPEYAREVLKAPETLKEYLAGLEGVTGLVNYGTQSHGDLLRILFLTEKGNPVRYWQPARCNTNDGPRYSRRFVRTIANDRLRGQ